MEARFGGRVVLATGAGHGIGQQGAQDFAHEGAYVAVNDVSADRAHSTAAQIESRGGRAEAFVADIRSESAVTQMIEAVLIKMGRIDILYNNAGIYPNRVLIDMTDAEWDRVWDTNVKGMFHVSRDVARHMISRSGPGKIVNASSTAALSERIGASH